VVGCCSGIQQQFTASGLIQKQPKAEGTGPGEPKAWVILALSNSLRGILWGSEGVLDGVMEVEREGE